MITIPLTFRIMYFVFTFKDIHCVFKSSLAVTVIQHLKIPLLCLLASVVSIGKSVVCLIIALQNRTYLFSFFFFLIFSLFTMMWLTMIFFVAILLEVHRIFVSIVWYFSVNLGNSQPVSKYCLSHFLLLLLIWN